LIFRIGNWGGGGICLMIFENSLFVSRYSSTTPDPMGSTTPMVTTLSMVSAKLWVTENVFPSQLFNKAIGWLWMRAPSMYTLTENGVLAGTPPILSTRTEKVNGLSMLTLPGITPVVVLRGVRSGLSGKTVKNTADWLLFSDLSAT